MQEKTEKEYTVWFNEQRGIRAAAAFTKVGWTVHCADDLAAAKKILFGTCLPKGVSVGLGGSETLSAMDVLAALRTPDYRLFDRYDPGADHFEVCRDSLMADYFLTGANALTLTGAMVNIDCSGSRVAAMAYGPKHVIVIAGTNKIVDTVDDAIARVHRIAPMNCRRNHHKTPCAENAVCADCNNAARMCNHLLITLNAQKFAGKYTLILINEPLGF